MDENDPSVARRVLGLAAFSLLAFGAVLGSTGHSLWETLSLTIVAVGGLALVRRRPHNDLILWGVLPLLYVYLRAEFVAELPFWVIAITGVGPTILLLGVALTETRMVPGGLAKLPVAGLAGLAVLTGVALLAEYPTNLLSGLVTVELVVLYCATVAFARSTERRLLETAFGIGVLSLVGCMVISWSMVGVAYYHFRTGSALFQAGSFERARHEVLTLRDDYAYLDFESLSPSGWIRNVREDIESVATVEQWRTLADLSMVLGDLKQAGEAYRSAHVLDPQNVQLGENYAQCLFQLGYRRTAMSEFDKILQEYPNSLSTRVFRAIAQARMGDIPLAKESIERACETGWSICNIVNNQPGGSVLRVNLEDLNPLTMDLQATGVDVYHVVRLLESVGISVLHPATEIGTTGVTSPVDIDLLSRSDDHSKREFLRVGGKNVSGHGRGYNIAVIDPTSGLVRSVGSFDTWLEIGQNRRLAKFVHKIPDGHIVAGTINDEGSAVLRSEGRNALKKLGVARFPGDWWAHAFIGVKGGTEGSALEALGERTIVSLGVLAGKSWSSTREGKFEQELLQAARFSPAGIAVYLSSLEDGADVSIGIARGEM